MDTVGTLTSIALQYGVPLESLVKKFAYQRFEPSGFTKNPDIRHATSITDYVFRWLACQFIKGYKEATARIARNPIYRSKKFPTSRRKHSIGRSPISRAQATRNDRRHHRSSVQSWKRWEVCLRETVTGLALHQTE